MIDDAANHDLVWLEDKNGGIAKRFRELEILVFA